MGVAEEGGGAVVVGVEEGWECVSDGLEDGALRRCLGGRGGQRRTEWLLLQDEENSVDELNELGKVV